eukprot:CAMPEP_0169084302 /NCGR_PEP_ID=MMETSP1015-20121227/12549_1 /TAXON_ID=342587 /ORGANISM="Karlodinium micrum, Strain CCMP2283" /LENGTH=470 /DNA_ID=CAMNT_0009144303 /DNA_START=413 /DNA_END=1825 /DNA_ORIENTATION=-
MKDSSTGLAEKNFASHRKDMIHFLNRVKARFTESFVGSKIDEMKFLEQFRKLLRHWLKVFEEASIDPVEHPLLIERFPKEFDVIHSVPELCDRVIERLNKTDLRMVSETQKSDNEEINKFGQSLETIKRNSMTMDAIAIPGQRDELTESLRELREMSGRNTLEAKRCGWCEWKAGCNCVCCPSEYPAVIGCGCFQLNILCREHWQMIFGIFIGTALAVWNLISPFVMKVKDEEQAKTHVQEAVWQAVPLLVYVASLIVLVVHIESICEILRLEREVANIKEEQKRLHVVHERMHDFYQKAQEVLEVWLWRTIPRLDLYKEMNRYIGDSDPSEIILQLQDVNESIKKLEDKLGPVSAWRGVAIPGREKENNKKKKLNEGIVKIIRESDGSNSNLRGLLTDLNKQLGEGGHLALLAPPNTTVQMPYTPGLSSTSPGGSFNVGRVGGPVPVNVPGWPKVSSNVELASVKREGP